MGLAYIASFPRSFSSDFSGLAPQMWSPPFMQSCMCRQRPLSLKHLYNLTGQSSRTASSIVIFELFVILKYSLMLFSPHLLP